MLKVFLISLLLTILMTSEANKRRIIGDCDQQDIDRIGCSDNILLEYLSNLVCCSCGSVGSPMKTEYASCLCKGDKVEITEQTAKEPPKTEGYPFRECFVNEEIITEELKKECCSKGRSGCSRFLEDKAAEILPQYCTDAQLFFR